MEEQYQPSVINTSAVAAPTVADVYSTANIAQTATSPVSAPVSAEQQLYNQYLNSADITSAKSTVSDIQKQINEANQAFRNAKTGFEYQNDKAMGTTGASANLIGRQIGRASDLTSNNVAALSENLSAQQAYLDSLMTDATNRYNIAKGERSQIQELITSTKGKANITYTDSYEDALKKAAKYEEKVLKEERKQAEKDELKSVAKKLGIKTSGLSRKELEKKINKYTKSQQAKQDEMDALDLAIKRKSLTGGGTSGERTGAVLATAQSALLSSRGSDGKVDPNVYTSQKSQYMRSGGSASEFDAQFGGLLSSREQTNLGLQTQETKPLSAEANKQYQTAQSGLRALDLIEQQASRGNLIQEALPGKLGAREFSTNIREAMDAISRLRTGAALTSNEEKFYRSQLPTVLDSQDTIKRKIQNLRDFFEGISRENGDSNNNSNNDPLGLGF